jgi:hypothetical protein
MVLACGFATARHAVAKPQAAVSAFTPNSPIAPAAVTRGLYSHIFLRVLHVSFFDPFSAAAIVLECFRATAVPPGLPV